MPLPDQGPGDLGSEQDPAGSDLGSVDEQATQEARIERALSALDSEHDHLRSMAVDELTGMNDPRATSALESVATSGDLSVDERRQAAEALWHHAADLEFADSAANDALRQLANGSDPSVRNIAERALTDMERYRQRQGR
jgi:HEAT repeat protein